MTDRYEKIRQALAMGPTPGPRRSVEQSVIGPHDLRILSANVTFSVGVNGSHSVLIEEAVANAALAAACDPDTIRELLAERDQLAAALDQARVDAERYRWLQDREIPEWLDLWRQNPDRIDAAIDAAQAQPKRRPYNASASLSEYGIFPECDAAPAAQAPRACTCHPDDRPDGPCRERYAASECQALAAQAQAANADALDAARYRWLRQRWGRVTETYDGDSGRITAIGTEHAGEGWDIEPETLDAAIDAAMEGEK